MTNKDWNGNSKSVFSTLGASNHSVDERQTEDYYATDPVAIRLLEEVYVIPHYVWECSCGEGHLSKELEKNGHEVYSSDLVDRGYGVGNVDFLTTTKLPNDNINCILTNPPYSKATEFALHALNLLKDGDYCIMFLKTTFLESKKRYEQLFRNNPPKYMYQFVSRIMCAKNGDFENAKANGASAVSYAWFIWEKGYKGDTIVRWIAN